MIHLQKKSGFAVGMFMGVSPLAKALCDTTNNLKPT